MKRVFFVIGRCPSITRRGAEDMVRYFDHFLNFFEGVRNGTPVQEDAVFGLRAAAPALACNDSYFGERIVRWDPERMELVE